MGDHQLAPGDFPWPDQIDWPEGEGPFVRAATLCDDVIMETSGSFSPFRMQNRLLVRGNPRLPISVPTMLFLSFEGFPKDVEEAEVRISIASPLGPQLLNDSVEMRPFGPFREANVRIDLPFPIALFGTHAIAIIYEQKVLSVLRVSVELDEEDVATGVRPLYARSEVIAPETGATQGWSSQPRPHIDPEEHW